MAGGREVGEGLRLAELLGALSLATDLAHQVPPESGLKNALLSVAFARHLGVTGPDLSDLYYLALINHLGCTTAAEEERRNTADDDDTARACTAADGSRANSVSTDAQCTVAPLAAVCEVAARLAERLSVGRTVCRALNETFVRWDGKPLSLPPVHSLSLIARITHVIHVAHIQSLSRGLVGAADVVRSRRGGELDPELVDAFLEVYPDLFASLDTGSVWDQAMEAEPPPHRRLPQSHLDELTLAIADFTDITSPFTLGHSRRVGEVAEVTGRCLGLADEEVRLLRLGGHVHDLGSVSVPVRVWTKPGPLSRTELEAVRLHTYQTERILSAATPLRPLAALAGFHHERVDGYGYHRGAPATWQSQAARVLAASEVYQAMLEERSWRRALHADEAGRTLVDEASRGRLDRGVVWAMLEAVGQRTGLRRVAWPSDLTEREVDVLRLLAAGHSNRAIARRLSVSTATVHTHTVNIYAKTEVHSRSGIALFAIENDLLALSKDRPDG